jgi:hypothetical protein
LLAFYVNNVCIASTSATYSVLFDRIPGVPVLVFFFSLLLIEGGGF